MPDQTLEAPSAVQIPAAVPRRRTRTLSSLALLRRPGSRWVLAVAALLVCSLLVVLWARVRPGYDPYGWLAWGKLSVHLSLDTNGAPSWKPLPFLFTVPYALFGPYALWLWMVTAVAASLSGPLFAWRIAFRLTAAPPERRYAAYAAGLAAALLVLGMEDVVGHLTYIHYVLSAESDTMIVALCLAAIDCHLCGRHRWAFWMWWLAALGRPEAWPFAGASAVWLWRGDPRFRGWLIGAVAAALFLWFGIPGLTSKSPFTAGNIAQNSPRQIRGNKVAGTLSRFAGLEPATVWVTAALTLAAATVRRNRTVLALAAGALLWLLIEVGFSLSGFPSVPRYMFEPAALVAVLAGVFVGWVILVLPRLISQAARGLSRSPQQAQSALRAGGWGTGLAVLAIAGSIVAPAHRQYQLERLNLTHERDRAVLIGRLSAVVDRLGPVRILACGRPKIPIGYQSVLAWYLGIKTGELYVSRTYERSARPLVNIYPIRGLGWKVFPSHVSQAATRCQGLRLVYR